MNFVFLRYWWDGINSGFGGKIEITREVEEGRRGEADGSSYVASRDGANT